MPRLAGVDAARGVALLGMMSVHIFPRFQDGQLTPAFALAAGRSAALFATLLGVGLALANGATRPPAGTALARAGLATVGRASVLAVVGLLLALAEPPVAIILVYYALLMVVAIPFLGLRSRPLAWLAVSAALLAPVALFLARRSGLGVLPFQNPEPGSLQEPAELLQTLLLTGVYPVLAWTAYLWTGLALGRLRLTDPRVLRRLLVAGVAVAAGAWAVSWGLLRWLGGLDRLATAEGTDPAALTAELQAGLFGNVPTTTPWWLAVVAPHSTTPFDLLHTAGTSVAIVAAMSLLALRLPVLIAPLAAVGSMTFTLYTLHCLLLAGNSVTGPPGQVYLVHVLVALAVATAWRTWVGRGPLESLASMAARGAAALVPARSTSVVR
jgi:uncharacterized membrane protein YeiB